VVAWISVFGCGPSAVHGPPASDADHLRSIVNVYAIANRDLGRPPTKMVELENVLAPVMKDPSSVFRSSRDGEQFVIVWGLDVGRYGNTSTPLAYEKNGVNGKRLIVDFQGKIREVSNEEFAQIKFPKGHTPGG
jgi:hypothetical protein